MSKRVFLVFGKLAVLSLFVVNWAATGCGSGGAAGSPAGTGGSAAGGGGGGSGGGVGSGGSSGGSGGGVGTVSCTSGGAEITSLPACAGGGATSAVDVPAGCTPTIDGSLHQEEWSDAACFTVASGNMIVRIKYSGDSVYMATSGAPTCGCGMPFEFDPDGTGAANGNEFAISVVDDPFGTNGDRSDFVLQNGAFVAGTVPTGIVVLCPGNQPSPIRYEWKIPFAALGITAGSAHSYRQAIIHSSVHWPDALVVTSGVAVDPANWGQMSSSKNWK